MGRASRLLRVRTRLPQWPRAVGPRSTWSVRRRERCRWRERRLPDHMASRRGPRRV